MEKYTDWPAVYYFLLWCLNNACSFTIVLRRQLVLQKFVSRENVVIEVIGLTLVRMCIREKVAILTYTNSSRPA